MWKVRWRSWGGEQMGENDTDGGMQGDMGRFAGDAGIGSGANGSSSGAGGGRPVSGSAVSTSGRPHLHQQLENDRELPVLAPPGVMTKNWKRFSTAVSVQENGAADRIHRVVPLPRGPEIILQTYP